MISALGFDTSNYTTSVALYGDCIKNCSRLLPVKEGSLGLRQSDAVFAHTNALHELAEELLSNYDGEIKAVGVSSFPRRVEGSYMPCFKVGEMVAHVVASVKGVSCHNFSHQEGHLAAALVSTGNEELLNAEFLAWHLSGGTTELLHVKPGLNITKIGGTSDISAGQLVDRTGVMLGLRFPAGRELDAMAEVAETFKIREMGYFFSLSGMENKAKSWSGEKEKLAGFVLGSVADVLYRVTKNALKEYGKIPVVVTGGVAGSRIIRDKMDGAIFCEPRYSSDNALGIAALAYLKGKSV